MMTMTENPRCVVVDSVDCAKFVLQMCFAFSSWFVWAHSLIVITRLFCYPCWLCTNTISLRDCIVKWRKGCGLIIGRW